MRPYRRRGKPGQARRSRFRATLPGMSGVTAADRGFVGRERELAQIGAALDDAAAGRGKLLMLAGEPGIGKTSVADRACVAARDRGMTVLWGRCWEAGGAPAYWPWLDIIAQLARALDDAALARALGDGASLLGEIVPELRPRLPDAPAGVPPPPEEGRFRLWRAVSGLVQEAARGLPALLVLDDLHAADPSSLSLLHFVARQLRSMRVLLLASYRDVEARMDAATSDLLSRVAREGTTLSLARLDREAAARFVQQRVGHVETVLEARLYDRSQGNPLFLEEMVRLWDEQGPGAVGDGVVPAGVRDVIRQRLDRVAPETRSLIDLAAVAGDVIDPPLLAAAAGRDAAWIAPRLGEAGRAGVLADRGGQRRFGHALFREVLYRELPEGERRALHGRVAAALERVAPGQIAELAHHTLEGPPELLARAVEHATRAAARAQELLAYDEAVRTLERARDAVVAAGNPPALRAPVLLALGEAHIRGGETEAGKQDCREAASLARDLGSAELGAQAALTYGRVFVFAMVDPILVGMLEESLETLPPGDSALRARLLARLAAALQPSPASAEPVALAREAIAIARRLGDEGTLLETLYAAVAALMDVVAPAETRALNLEISALAEALGDRERSLRTHLRLAIGHLGVGDLPACDAQLTAFEELAGRLRAPWYAWWGVMLRAVRATMEGRFDDAERLASAAREAGRAVGHEAVDRIWTTNRESRLRAADRHPEMLAWDPEGRRARSATHIAVAWQSMGSALLFARLERPADARTYIELTPQEFRPPDGNVAAVYFTAEAVALAGPPELARQIYDLARPLAGQCAMIGMSYLGWEGPWSRVLGLLAAYLERWDEAADHFEQAIADCRRMGARPYLARTEYEYGRALLARGDRVRAKALIASARAAAEALGMTGLVRLADDKLSRLEGAVADAPPNEAGPPPFSFRREGEYWTVSFAETTFRLKDSLGIQYLVRLIDQPGREIHVLDLAGERAAAGPGVNEAIDTGDAGELLDAEARRSYQRRLEDLEETVAEAESFGDSDRAGRARAEIEMLAGELGRAVGLGGRPRRAGGAAERARSAVQRRIKNALERVGEHAPGLAELLGRSIRTGNYCVFRPAG
jgi:tetratricopeptide (TPR) repeat protein